MRRTIRYSAGLMIVAGATVAFAGPASASAPRPGDYSGLVSAYGVNVQTQVATPVNVVLNNIANTQVGNHNSNGGGSASAGIWSGQFQGGFFR